MAETDIETRATTRRAPAERTGQRDRAHPRRPRPTIDEIADRVAPGNVARRTADRAKERLSQVDPLIGGAVALAVVSVTCYLIWRKLRK